MNDDGFEPLAPPRPGEWRFVFKEAVQDFDRYVQDNPNRKTARRCVLYLQPLGDAGDRYAPLLEPVRRHMELYFQLEARILPPLPLPRLARRPDRPQLESTPLLDYLADREPHDALVSLGLCSEDLFARDLPYVFGEGGLHNRSAVCSLHRHATSDEALFLRRALKLTCHETAHGLSLMHCPQFRCLMQGANSIEEHDRQPLQLCPEDLEKLRWNCGFDARERYRGLSAWYREVGLEDEADRVSRQLERLP